MRKKRQSFIMGIILLVLALGIGYAYLNTTLNISGTTDIDANTWNIYWDNVQVTSGSVAAEEPAIDTSLTTVSFSVHLKKPGDFYEFTVDAKNDGTIDAMINSIIKTVNNGSVIPTYLNYSVTYSDDIELLKNQLLAANTTETIKIRVEYRTDINPGDLPDTDQSLNMVFGIEYVQGDSNGFRVRDTVYHIASGFTLGSPVPKWPTTYSSYQDVYEAWGNPYFLKHKVVNNIVLETYVGFIVNDNVYYLRAGVDEADLSEKPIYESNKQLLLSLFGEEHCTETTYDSSTYTCKVSVVDGIDDGYDFVYTTSDSDGYADVTHHGVYCYCSYGEAGCLAD